jgi:hypothetical protein
MTRHQTAQVLAGASAVGFLLAAGLHTSEYRRVVLRAQQGFAGLAPFVATLCCFPSITVLLQLHFLGFTPPVAIFSAVAAMNFAAALTFPTARRLAPPQTSPAA